MRVVFVSAAWQRYAVTRLALAQRRHLCELLAGRGHEATAVIVADDENLDIASEFGFETVEQSNDQIGRKFNDGFEYAARELDADFVVLIGSDDWMHIDLFDYLPRAELPVPMPTDENPCVTWAPGDFEITAGREFALVDLQAGRLQRCRELGRGAVPWVVPRSALEPDYRPIPDTQQMGIDGAFRAGLNATPVWVFDDPHDLARVDFKSSVNLNGYERISRAAGRGPEEDDPWTLLAERYPEDLVELARKTHEAEAYAGAHA